MVGQVNKEEQGGSVYFMVRQTRAFINNVKVYSFCFFPFKKKKKKLPLPPFPSSSLVSTPGHTLSCSTHRMVYHHFAANTDRELNIFWKIFFFVFFELFIILDPFELYNFSLPVGGLFLLLFQLLSSELFGLLLQTEHQSMGMQEAFITCICLCGTFLLAESWQASWDTNSFFKTLSQSHGIKPAAVHLPGNDRGPTLSDPPNEGHAGKIVIFLYIYMYFFIVNKNLNSFIAPIGQKQFKSIPPPFFICSLHVNEVPCYIIFLLLFFCFFLNSMCSFGFFQDALKWEINMLFLFSFFFLCALYDG